MRQIAKEFFREDTIAMSATAISPEEEKILLAYADVLGKLDETTDVHKRLIQLDYASVSEDGKFALHPAHAEPLERVLSVVKKGEDAGLPPAAIAAELARAAAARGASPTDTFVVYVIVRKGVFAGDFSDGRMYVGKTVVKMNKRWSLHPRGCPLLENAIEETDGGKSEWVCMPVMVLPVDGRCSELILV